MTFIRSLMEWMGGWVAREDGGPAPVGKDGGRGRKRRRRGREEEEEEDEETLLAAVALRFRYASEFVFTRVV